MFFSNKAKINPMIKQLPTSASQLKDTFKSGIGFLSGLNTHPYVEKAKTIFGHLKNGYDNAKSAYDHFQANKDNYIGQANNLIDQGSKFAQPFIKAYQTAKA